MDENSAMLLEEMANKKTQPDSLFRNRAYTDRKLAHKRNAITVLQIKLNYSFWGNRFIIQRERIGS